MWLDVWKSTLQNHLMGPVKDSKWSLAQNLDFFGPIGQNIKFGGLSFTNKKVVTVHFVSSEYRY